MLARDRSSGEGFILASMLREDSTLAKAMLVAGGYLLISWQNGKQRKWNTGIQLVLCILPPLFVHQPQVSVIVLLTSRERLHWLLLSGRLHRLSQKYVSLMPRVFFSSIWLSTEIKHHEPLAFRGYISGI